MDVRSLGQRRSYCRVCSTHCGIVVEYSGTEIIKIRGDKEHPLSQGYTCPKGRAIGQLHHHPDAITQPMMRKGGILELVSWNECLDDLGTRLRSVIDAHGSRSVGIFFGSGIGLDGIVK